MRIPCLLATLVAISTAPACSLELGEPCVRAVKTNTFQDEMRYVALEKETFEALAREAPSLSIQTETFISNTSGDVVVASVDPEDIGRLSTMAHKATHRCGGFTAHRDLDSAVERATQRRVTEATHRATLSYVIDNGVVANAMVAEAKEANIIATIEALSAFNNRHHASSTGAEASLWLRDYWLQLAGSRSDVTVEQINHSSTPQKSVVMTITGATLPNEVIVLGGHLDSIAGGQNDRAPGADDDASGIATISEVARVIFGTGFKPNRTIKFMGYAGEEVGLRGSDEIAQAHANQGIDVAAVMQLDMTNYNGSATDITFFRDRTNDQLTEFTASLVDAYLPGITRANGQCGYGCSDHASWDARGFPAVYPAEASFQESNNQIHTASDTIAVSQNNAQHALKFAKLASAFVAETAKGEFDDGMEPGGDPDPPNPNDDENGGGGGGGSDCQ